MRTVICPDFLIVLIYCRVASSITVRKTTNQQFIKKVLKLLMDRQIIHVFFVFFWEISCAWHQREDNDTKKQTLRKPVPFALGSSSSFSSCLVSCFSLSLLPFSSFLNFFCLSSRNSVLNKAWITARYKDLKKHFITSFLFAFQRCRIVEAFELLKINCLYLTG